MNNIRIYLIKFLFIILAFQILNLSVYGNEYIQQSVDKDGHTTFSKNQIDCFAEYFAEIVLEHHNAMPEHKGNHTKNEVKIIKTPLLLFAQNKVVKITHRSYHVAIQHSHYNNQYDYLYFKEINPPPPKEA